MNMGTNGRVAAFNLGLKGSLMLYVLGSILFIASSMVAVAVIGSQIARYRHLAVMALRGLSMNGLQTKKAPAKMVSADALAQRFNLQPAPLPWKPQAVV